MSPICQNMEGSQKHLILTLYELFVFNLICFLILVYALTAMYRGFCVQFAPAQEFLQLQYFIMNNAVISILMCNIQP